MSQNQDPKALDIALHWQHDGVLFNDWIHIPDYRCGYDRFSFYEKQSGQIPAQNRIANDNLRLEAAHLRPGNGHVLKDKHPQMSVRLRMQDGQVKSSENRKPYNIDAILFGQGIGAQIQFANFNDEDFNASAMSRVDENDDLDYFSVPDFQPYWPFEESRFVSSVYDRELESGHRVLDLMAGVHSPLAESSTRVNYLACAGLNKKELELNPLCDHKASLNVNSIEKLPYATDSYDAILLHAAIEYVTRPRELFAEMRRVLPPGGKIIMSFNHRTEPQKAIWFWRNSMDFEHVAIVVYYLRNLARCKNITAESHRIISYQTHDPAYSGNPTCIVCGQLE